MHAVNISHLRYSHTQRNESLFAFCVMYLDRYVLMGNHRDAWVVGSVDPTSGTAVMMEVSRAMGAMLQKGRYNADFCNCGRRFSVPDWDSEDSHSHLLY